MSTTSDMVVRHRADMIGNRFTECRYTIDGLPACARLHGHLTPYQAEALIQGHRERDRKRREGERRGP